MLSEIYDSRQRILVNKVVALDQGSAKFISVSVEPSEKPRSDDGINNLQLVEVACRWCVRRSLGDV